MESATLTQPRPDSTPLQRLRAVDASTWAKLAFALLCVVALIGYFAFPTYPTYDSFYALLWGRDLLHLHLPDFQVYRGPTEHPLAIAFGMLCSIFGQGGARLMVLGSIASFVALVAGIYRLARLCFGPVVGLFAALLLLSRFFVENLAAQGYLDISYVALIVWAVALEVERPAARHAGVPAARGRRAAAPRRVGAERRLLAVVLLAGASRGRSDLATARACSTSALARDRAAGVGRRRRDRDRQPAVLADATAGLAQELERTQGFSSVVASVWTYAVRIDKLPVVLGGLIGVPLAVWLAPRRVLVPLAALVAARVRVPRARAPSARR